MSVTTEEDSFTRLTDPYRRELHAYCYRMLGSVHDAEDLVQETLLRAWRAYGRFEGRSSLRTWLYRIATNVCLTALENRSRRPLPSGLAGPGGDPDGLLGPASTEVPWLEPFPDTLMGTEPDDPAAIVASRAGMRLAFVAALQYLPARQRAVLILRDVLGWRAAETAGLLGMTVTAVNSGLRRARAQLAEAAPDADAVSEPANAEQRALLDRYVEAFENADATLLTRLFTEDAVWEMPPQAVWFAGRENVGRLVSTRWHPEPGGSLMMPTRANGQPAFAMYTRDDSGVHRLHMIQVLTLAGSEISRVVSFRSEEVFEAFGLPLSL
jgi:RNA polymerase sigma-70 factor (ECF subfamily)